MERKPEHHYCMSCGFSTNDKVEMRAHMCPHKIRKETRFITEVPSGSGAIVAMCEYKGVILLACQYHIYQLCESDMVFKKLEFEEVKDPTADRCGGL